MTTSKNFSFDHIEDYLQREVVVIVIHKPTHQQSSSTLTMGQVHDFATQSIKIFREQIDSQASDDDFLIVVFDKQVNKAYVANLEDVNYE